MKMHLPLFFLLSGILILTGCASSGSVDDPTSQMDVAELYNEARDKLLNNEYETAAQLYEKLESRFPYGPYAERARLEIAYAYYKDSQPETAILAADRFIKLHPNHKHVDYAYYLRGLASFDGTLSFFDKLFDQNPADRDPKRLRQAFQYFAELVQKYPKSRYTRDAIERMKQLRENLAYYETRVAEYYGRTGAYLSSANRAKYVVDNYQGSAVVPEALGIMVGAYRKLGMHDLANDALRVMEMNYPENEKTRELVKSRRQP